jgi:glycosyltransferase involved in cell wall biosynthesis
MIGTGAGSAGSDSPHVDVNLFVFNGEATIGAAIDSVLRQSWPALTLTVIDNASNDRTTDIVEARMAQTDRLHLRRNRVNAGPVLNCQRAFWHGDADFVMPKTADDLLAPDFMARVMEVMLGHPDCAMCHAGGEIFTADGEARHPYPVGHRLHAVGPNPRARAAHVMQRYTSAPSFWGIYRRGAVDRLARIPYRAGWDHVLLAELALYGEIRHVPDVLFWRRSGGKPVGALARGCTEASQRGLPLDDALAELRWRTPLITTAYAHIELFARVPLTLAARQTLIHDAQQIFGARWGPLLRQEAMAFRALLPALLGGLAGQQGASAVWLGQSLIEAISAITAVLPDEAFTQAHLEIAALAGALSHTAG